MWCIAHMIETIIKMAAIPCIGEAKCQSSAHHNFQWEWTRQGCRASFKGGASPYPLDENTSEYIKEWVCNTKLSWSGMSFLSNWERTRSNLHESKSKISLNLRMHPKQNKTQSKVQKKSAALLIPEDVSKCKNFLVGMSLGPLSAVCRYTENYTALSSHKWTSPGPLYSRGWG